MVKKVIAAMLAGVVTAGMFSTIAVAANSNVTDTTFGSSYVNNPTNEILTENPSVLPMSDSGNTMNWMLSETFSDEFTSSKLDTTKWKNYSMYNWSGRAPSYFVKDNVRVEDGYLILTSDMPSADKYEAAMASSTQKTGYGYYEVKTRTAPISMTSSFWFRTRANDSDNDVDTTLEVDVFEQVGKAKNDPSYSTKYPINTHYSETGKTDYRNSPYTYNTNVDLTEDFHVYGFEFGPEWLKFYFDGELIHTKTNDGFTEEMYLMFDMETFTWKGLPTQENFYYDETGRFTGDYYIDYVRVWRTAETQIEGAVKEEIPAPLETSAFKATPADITDPIWEEANVITATNPIVGGPEAQTSTLTAKTLWDDEYLYILAEVTDTSIYVAPYEKNIWNGDSVEIFLDFMNVKADVAKDPSYNKMIISPEGVISSGSFNIPQGATASSMIDDKGYAILVKVPIATVEISSDNVIGFDIQLNDATLATKKRNGAQTWNDPTGTTNKYMERSGNLILSNEEIVLEEEYIAKQSEALFATVDGIVDRNWTNANIMTDFYTVFLPSIPESIIEYDVVEKSDITIKTLNDSQNVYFLIDVIDDDIFKHQTASWNSDTVELFIDMGNEKNTTSYDSNDAAIKVYADGQIASTSKNVPTGTTVISMIDETGYKLLVTLPIDEVGIIGFDAQLNIASSVAGQRIATKLWNDKTGSTWKTMEKSGDLIISNVAVKPAFLPTENIYTVKDLELALVNPEVTEIILDTDIVLNDFSEIVNVTGKDRILNLNGYTITLNSPLNINFATDNSYKIIDSSNLGGIYTISNSVVNITALDTVNSVNFNIDGGTYGSTTTQIVSVIESKSLAKELITVKDVTLSKVITLYTNYEFMNSTNINMVNSKFVK